MKRALITGIPGHDGSYLAELVLDEGDIAYDTSKLDGTPRKILDVSRLSAMGWHPKFGLRDGIEDAFRWFAENEG